MRAQGLPPTVPSHAATGSIIVPARDASDRPDGRPSSDPATRREHGAAVNAPGSGEHPTDESGNPVVENGLASVLSSLVFLLSACARGSRSERLDAIVAYHLEHLSERADAPPLLRATCDRLAEQWPRPGGPAAEPARADARRPVGREWLRLVPQASRNT